MTQTRTERSVLGAFGATAIALLVLVWWTREQQVAWAVAALAACFAAVVLGRRGDRSAPGRRALLLSQGLLLLGVAGAGLASWQFHRIERGWSDIVAQRHATLSRELSERMTDVVRRGRDAAADAARAAAASPARAAAGDLRLFNVLEELREQHEVDALAVYSDAGSIRAWSGEHRGRMPDSVRVHTSGAYYEERPLFSYIYFPVAVPGRAEHAIAAVLVETGMVTEQGEGPVTSVVATRTGARASFRRGGGTDAAWSLTAGADTVVHARLDPLTQGEWRAALELLARRLVLLAALSAFLALAFAWLLRTAPAPASWMAGLPLVLLGVVAAAAPLRETIGAEELFSPLLFSLPMRGDLTLGHLLAALLPLTALVASARRQRGAPRHLMLAVAVGAAAVAAAYPLVLHVLLDGATSALAQGGAVYWLGLQVAGVLILSTVTVVALPHSSAGSEPARRSRALVASSLVISGVLAVVASMGAEPNADVRLIGASLWVVPYVLAAYGLAAAGGRTGSVSRWLLAGWLAATAVLPHLWVAHVEARLAAAEKELQTLGTRPDPFLDYLLLNSFSREAVERFEAGEQGVQLLYRTWVASGLAREPYPARIVLWSPDLEPLVQLGSAAMPRIAEEGFLYDLLFETQNDSAPTITPFIDQPDLSRLLTVPLRDGSQISVMVPPRRTLDRTSAIAPFLGVIAQPNTRLNLVEATTDPGVHRDSVKWERSPTGWRSEALVMYPDGWYHAHLAVDVATPLTSASSGYSGWGSAVRFARGALLLTFDLSLLALLWLAGVTARGGAAVPRRHWTGWLGSFRARITVALFGFFVVPTALFGWVAYRALAGEVSRAAQTIAQHSVAQAVVEFQEGNANLRDLAAHAGTDVLLFLNGELIDVSAPEARDLGVYNAWMPPTIFDRLSSGEELEALETQTLGEHSYVTAYHTLRPSGTLAVPKSLTAGDTSERQREFAHLVLFAVVIGGLLSLALSVAVGRTLAGPIGLLSRASAAVGAGSLRIRLPERTGDEFGQVYASFNRMTRRLRRARARELRTARVLAWGEMARQVAHEIKNPLTPIKLAVQHLRRAHADRHPQFEEILDSNVSQILVEIDRLSEIARAFSRYGAPSLASGPLTSVDVGSVVREALMLYRSGDRELRYEDELEPGLPRVCARPNELKEVLLNLLENARAALDGRGVIAIRGRLAGDVVEIEIADNGPGMSADLLERIFEPHFSTRSSGTGLGLAIVRRLVESWGGTVNAESETGWGTIVRVRLQLDSTLEGGMNAPPSAP